MRLALSALFVLAACKRDPTPTPTPSSAPQARAVEDAGVPAAEVQRAYLVALNEARAHAAKKDYPAAIKAFEAAHRLSPYDARALGELGFTRFNAGDLDGAERDLDQAHLLGANEVVSAQLWFNSGLVREKRGNAAAAREAFMLSQSIHPTAAAAAKIGSAAVCSAAVLRATGEDLVKAGDWRAAATALQIEAGDEAQAKSAVCIHSWTADGSGDDHDVCTGPSPWLVSHDHQMYFQRAHAIFQATAKSPLFIADQDMTGSWPAHCTGSHDATAKIVGNVAWTTSTFDGGGALMLEQGASQKGAVNPVDMGDVTCADAPGAITDQFFDLRTGAQLVKVTRPIPIDAKAPKAMLTVQGTQVVLAGGGCDQHIDLTHP
jgi:tetratricopeptide (TPR) repeat protein